MPTTAIDTKRQITIPDDIFKELQIKTGDSFYVLVEDHSIRLIPQNFISNDQSWFWTPEWQAKEREADEAIARGEVKEFDNVEDLLKDLNT
ncbi:MAG: AbrB/MazE/SpoVT family DNA-binding domain-containing protein [Nitrospirota bacterium]